jgi:hypothetical protein
MLINKDTSISLNNFNDNIINIIFIKKLLNSFKHLFKIVNNEVNNYIILYKRFKASKDNTLLDS